MNCELCKKCDNTEATHIAYGVGDNGQEFEYKVCTFHCDMAMVAGWKIKSLPTERASDERNENDMAYEPKGIQFFDAISNRQMLLVAEGEPFAGWLCYRHPDGQWVSLREATNADRAKLASALVLQLRR